MEFDDAEIVFYHACKLGLEGIVSKRKDSVYRSGRSRDWLKMKNPACGAVRREAEEDWGTLRILGILVNFAAIQCLVPRQYRLGQEHPYV